MIFYLKNWLKLKTQGFAVPCRHHDTLISLLLHYRLDDTPLQGFEPDEIHF